MPTPIPYPLPSPRPPNFQASRRAVVVRAALELQAPPYALDALEPHMSKNTLEYHWGKHHRAYVGECTKSNKCQDKSQLLLPK